MSKTRSSVSFNDFVSAPQHDARNGKTKDLCGPEVEHHFVPVRGLHRKVARLRSLEDTIDIIGGTAILVEKNGPVGDQATGENVEAEGIDHGQAVPGRKAYYELAVNG